MGVRSSQDGNAAPSFSIGELSRRVGVTPRTIRYYEDIGLMGSVRRMDGGRRVYTDEDVRRLKFINRLKLLGLSLDDMRELEDLYLTCRSNEKVLPRLLELLDRHLESVTSRIEQLRMLKRDIEAYKHHIQTKL